MDWECSGHEGTITLPDDERGAPDIEWNSDCPDDWEDIEVMVEAAASGETPDAKHLDVCRLQLAGVVGQLEAVRPWVEWRAKEWGHRRIEDWPHELLRAARALKIIPEGTAAT